ncbi:hypothetical protein TanjilG_08299 [Lupinus angustifolius]|uniref:Uncharacterized protein n=1 Tax=Lupinus angustifolius TaxID=3871 RepID=A0A4P1QP41_LUPAN|nr:hypothetical protein TanjilG_08299 [Lupinus angustifolius]
MGRDAGTWDGRRGWIVTTRRDSNAGTLWQGTRGLTGLEVRWLIPPSPFFSCLVQGKRSLLLLSGTMHDNKGVPRSDPPSLARLMRCVSRSPCPILLSQGNICPGTINPSSSVKVQKS